METLRIINAANKNVGYRTLSEVERALDNIRVRFGEIDTALDLIATAALKVSVSTPKNAARKLNRSGNVVETLDAPTTSTLEKNLSIVHTLSEQLANLNSILAQLDSTFAGERTHSKVVKEVKSLIAEGNKKLKVADAAIGKIADGKVSKNFKEFYNTVADGLEAQLDGSYASVDESLYIDINQGDLRFTYYLTFTGLKDSSGFTFRKYHVCITHIVGVNVDAYWINTIPTFKIPGQFSMGTSVTDAAIALERIEMIMRGEGFRQIMGNAAQPLNRKDIPSDKFSWIERVKVTDDWVEFTIVEGRSLDDAEKDLFLLYRGLVDTKLKTKNSPIKYQTNKSKRTIRFVLAPVAPIKLNRVKLQHMAKELGLDEEDVRKIQQQVL